MDADAANLRQLTFDSPGDTTFPLWSLDGKEILFRRNFVSAIVDVGKDWSEGSLRLLPAPPNNERFLGWDWSPDGKRVLGTMSGPKGGIAYYSFETNSYRTVVQFDGGPMWLPDSTRFIFFVDEKAYLSDINTRRVREIFGLREGQLRSIDLSANGELLYFTVYSEESDIWLLDME